MMTIPFQVGIGSGPPIPPSSFQPPHFESLASSTWSGLLPQKQYSNPVYSCKIFLGGVPWDVTEVGLVQVKKNELFSTFNRVCTIRTSAEVLALALGVEPDLNLTLTL